jgi:UDP-N-acetylglucosamine 4,6-dehydratase
MLGGKVLITGGTGFLGRAIMRRAQRDGWNDEFTVYSRDEYKQMQCKRKYRANYILGDIRDYDRLEAAMIGHDTVVHTAAIKFIPEAEFNVAECIAVNIQGSQTVANAAAHANVGMVIGISTDKACEPVNTYGMTKALMERTFGEYSRNYPMGPAFVCCRYGNVIGSTGSVVPFFKQQLLDQGYITLTDPRMTRYFISCDAAVDLIVAAFKANNGSTIFPAPASVSTNEIAHLLAGEDTNKIRVIGLRPGEKMHEHMVSLQESTRVCSWPDNKYYELLRVGEVGDSTPFELTSERAERIPAWRFAELVEDAENV